MIAIWMQGALGRGFFRKNTTRPKSENLLDAISRRGDNLYHIFKGYGFS